MADGQLAGTALIAGVHGLRGAENLRNLRLRQVGILAQIADDLHICLHANHPPCLFFREFYHSKHILFICQ